MTSCYSKQYEETISSLRHNLSDGFTTIRALLLGCIGLTSSESLTWEWKQRVCITNSYQKAKCLCDPIDWSSDRQAYLPKSLTELRDLVTIDPWTMLCSMDTRGGALDVRHSLRELAGIAI